MANVLPFDRDQPFLLPPDLTAWIPDDDLAHFVVAAVERVPLHNVAIPRRIERATDRDIAVRFIAASQHPDHDTIATFRRTNAQAFEAAFLQVLLLARETGLLRLGTGSIDGT